MDSSKLVLTKVINLLQRDKNGRFEEKIDYISKEELVDDITDQVVNASDENPVTVYNYSDEEKKKYGVDEDYSYSKKV